MRILHIIAFVLLVIGGLNWGLVGLFNYNLVTSLFGEMSTVTTAIYILVGLSALFEAVRHPHHCKMCKPEMASAPSMQH